jgi:hypothetical protein
VNAEVSDDVVVVREHGWTDRSPPRDHAILRLRDQQVQSLGRRD